MDPSILEQYPILLPVGVGFAAVLFFLFIVVVIVKVIIRDQPIKLFGVEIGAPESARQTFDRYSKDEVLRTIDQWDPDFTNQLLERLSPESSKRETIAGLIYFNPNHPDADSPLRRQIHDMIKEEIEAAKTTRILLATAGPVFTEPESVLSYAVTEKLKTIEKANHTGSTADKKLAGTFQLLLLDPQYDKEISRRARDTDTPVETYRSQIYNSIERLAPYTERSKSIEVRLYQQAPLWKLFIFDTKVFVQFYFTGRTGLQSPLYVFSLDTPESLGIAFEEIFDTMWEEARMATTEMLLPYSSR